MDWSDLLVVLAWVASGTGAGVIAFKVMNKIDWQPAKSELKRYASLALSVALAWAAWGLLLWFKVQPLPVGLQEWVARVFAIAVPAIISAQSLHAATALRAADKVVAADIKRKAEDATWDNLTN